MSCCDCCKELACSHSVVAAATKEASRLTDKEREIILGVLGRDERLRRDQFMQVMHLKAELQNLRRKAALRPSTDFEKTGPDPDRSCGRCRAELGRVINRGAYCRACRLKVCKSCREYPFRTTDWVCTVCHKHMEIQAASGEWMNEFVRRPSRSRDNRVYVPAADIIKRTIRRSWTISNPTTRWNALRNETQFRPYNSLPRGQDINTYPALALHQNVKNQKLSAAESFSPSARRRSPTRRAHSEDVYSEREEKGNFEGELNDSNCQVEGFSKRQPRINPLMMLSAEEQDEKKNISHGKSQEKDISENVDREEKGVEKNIDFPELSTADLTKKKRDETIEKRVSFESTLLDKTHSGKRQTDTNVPIDQSLEEENRKENKFSEDRQFDRNEQEEVATGDAIKDSREETASSASAVPNPVEKCDVELFSGTVFRKVTVRRRRRDNMRKVPAVDSGWRRAGPSDHDLLDILLPDGEDYKLVFIGSDGSSKEEDLDDNDSSSTASSFPVDECDWDYFEPGSTTVRPALNRGSPRVYGREVVESPVGSPIAFGRARESDTDTGTDEDNARLDGGSPTSEVSFSIAASDDPPDSKRCPRGSGSAADGASASRCRHGETNEAPHRPPCRSCGAPTRYIPIPVPVPIPFPVPAAWTQQQQEAVEPYGGGRSVNAARLGALARNLWPYVGHQAALIWPLISGDASTRTATMRAAAVDSCVGVASEDPRKQSSSSAEEAATAIENEGSLDRREEETEFGGHLECEYKCVGSDQSTDDGSDSSDSSDDAEKPRSSRVYDVNGEDGRQSDCYRDDQRVSHGSGEEDDTTSSDSADSDGRKTDEKSKRFFKIFVVNKRNVSHSSSSNEITSTTDTSDNDTDTEMDCTVVLTNIKQIDGDSAIKLSASSNDVNEEDDKTNAIDIDDDRSKRESDKKVPDCDSNSINENVGKNKDFDNSTDCKESKRHDNESEYISSSPGLSDASVESSDSSDADVEQPAEESPEIRVEVKTETADNRANDGAAGSEWNASPIRSAELAVNDEVGDDGSLCGERAGAPPPVRSPESQRNAARYTSLVMITQEPAPNYQQVSVVTSDTTTVVANDNDVIVRHTNRQAEQKSKNEKNDESQNLSESVTVITGGDTLSAFEEGLADDDSWVENLSHDDEDDDTFATNSPSEESSSGEEVTLTCSSAVDQEDELRGYHRTAIDFTLHTIAEESCEESEVEQNVPKKKDRPASATDLEKYFFFGLGDGTASSSVNSNKEDTFSETSSIYSEGMESLGHEGSQQQNEDSDPAELASSRLEKYFLSGFMGFTAAAERKDSDGSVGSDSEGRPSPEQRRKKLVRARGTGRSHSSSLDNLDNAGNSDHTVDVQLNSEHSHDSSSSSSSSDSDTYDEINSFEKSDGQFDTVKRKKSKNKQKNAVSPAEETKNLETTQEVNEISDTSEEEEDGHRTPQPEVLAALPSNLTTSRNQQQSRDSGFIGSCDDLLKEQRLDSSVTSDLLPFKSGAKSDMENIEEEILKPDDNKVGPASVPPATSLTRKDSFNNWSSDEETNLMMCKMRQFFKTMVANSQQPSKPTTPTPNSRMQSPRPSVPNSPGLKSNHRCKPPQLVYFENELTRLMKTVPGIRDDQVREIVEYLSSEDTWSDSYDSSDYTSSDLEGASITKSALQQQISDSCKQIINKFDTSHVAADVDQEGVEGDGGIADESSCLSKETAFVYQKLVASFGKMATGEDAARAVIDRQQAPHSSPPLIAKVMHHIGSRLVALMHEVSSGETHSQSSNSPKTKHYHRRLQHKISSASSTTTEDDCPDGNFGRFEEGGIAPCSSLPRSRSHDLLVGETSSRTLMSQCQSADAATSEEREASDCERFSWRGSFESALLAADSRTKLSLLGGEGSASASASAMAAKRRSAGDLLFNHNSPSREQLDRVRSCGSIGGANIEDKLLWVTGSTNRPNRRRSSVPDAASCGSGGSADGEDEDEEADGGGRSTTLPRGLHSGVPTTNSLPRLPINAPPANVQKSQSMYHFQPHHNGNVKSARYRPPGFNRLANAVPPKRAVSAPGLQPSQQRRVRRSQPQNVPSDDVSISEAHSSPMLTSRNVGKTATCSPAPTTTRKGAGFKSSDWQNDEDIDRLVGLHTRSNLSSLGLRSDSMASVYSGAGEGRYGTVAVKGQVEFGLQYNYKAGALEIQMKQCKDLAAVDAKRNRSDPYVKVYLLPDKSKSGKRKTKVKKHTLNPVFEECLKFHISLNGLETRTLWLTVWHSDMFGRNDFLGEVMMALENKVFDDPTPKWYNLQERTEPFEDVLSYKGDIIVCLKFVPPDMTVHKKGKRSRGALRVLVKEAKTLTAVKANGSSDSFCKSYLLPDKGRSSKQKTPVARRTNNPVWNYTFVYEDVTLQELAERCLELTVWDHDRLASNEFLGGVRFSLGSGKHYGKMVEWMDATGKELSLWKSMLERPNFWVEGCVSLRPSLETRSS